MRDVESTKNEDLGAGRGYAPSFIPCVPLTAKGSIGFGRIVVALMSPRFPPRRHASSFLFAQEALIVIGRPVD